MRRCLAGLLLVFGLVGKFSVIDETKAAVSSSITKAPSPFVFAAEGVVKLDVAIKPKSATVFLKIDGLSDGERSLQQTTQYGTRFTRLDNQLVRHNFTDFVFSDSRKVAFQKDQLVAKFFQDCGSSTEVFERVANTWSFGFLVEHGGGFIPKAGLTDDFADSFTIDLNKQIRPLGFHEGAGVAIRGVGSSRSLAIRNARLACLNCGDLPASSDLPFTRTPEFVRGVPECCSEDSNGERRNSGPNLWRRLTQPFYARDYYAFTDGAVIVVGVYLIAIAAAAFATRRDEQ
jgi:hypothetical protein